MSAPRLPHADKFVPDTHGSEFRLPNFRNTEEALRFAAFITRDQFLCLLGARAALEAEFNESRDVAGAQQRQADIACKLQLLRECIEAAPDAVLATLIGSSISEFLGNGSRLSGSSPTLHPSPVTNNPAGGRP